MHRFGLMGRAQNKIYKKLLRPGFTVVDVGANQGLYSLLFSTLTGPEGRVFCFEPDAALFAALETNCRRNHATNVTYYNYALGAKAETSTLYHSRLNSGDNRLATSDRPDWFYEVSIKTSTLDSFLGDTRVEFIKIDVQGWEFEVMKGMTEVWKNSPGVSLYFEFWPFGLRRAGCDPVHLLDHVQQHGFTLYDMAGSNPRPLVDLNAFCAEFHGYKATNILATRELPSWMASQV
jgi:FkbM family methyltransferase